MCFLSLERNFLHSQQQVSNSLYLLLSFLIQSRKILTELIGTHYHTQSVSILDRMGFEVICFNSIVKNTLRNLFPIQVRPYNHDQFVIMIHQKPECSVIDHVVLCSFILFLPINLVGINLELLHGFNQSRIVILNSTYPNNSLIKHSEEVLNILRGISVGVEFDKNNFKIEELGLRVISEKLHGFAHSGEEVGADIRALGKPKVHNVVGTPQILMSQSFSFAVNQFPWSSDAIVQPLFIFNASSLILLDTLLLLTKLGLIVAQPQSYGNNEQSTSNHMGSPEALLLKAVGVLVAQHLTGELIMSLLHLLSGQAGRWLSLLLWGWL